MLLGGRLPERLRQTVVAGLGLFVLVLGVQTFLQTRNSTGGAGQPADWLIAG
jgi:uncharacterized protein